MNTVINPSIFKAVYERILTEGKPSSHGFFLKGIYAFKKDDQQTELNDRFSRICAVDDKITDSEFASGAQRVRFLKKVRNLYSDE